MTPAMVATAMATLERMVTTTEPPGVQEAGQEEIEEGIVIAAPVAMADSIQSLHSNHLSHPQFNHPRSAGAIGQIGIDSNSHHSLLRGHGREMERWIGDIRVQGMIAPARLRGTNKRVRVEI
jgi:hypothetical protein